MSPWFRCLIPRTITGRLYAKYLNIYSQRTAWRNNDNPLIVNYVRLRGGKKSQNNWIYLPNLIADWFSTAGSVSTFARGHLQDSTWTKWREDEYIFVFSGEAHVQCLSLCIHLYYIKQAVPCQSCSTNKAMVISSNTFNDVVVFPFILFFFFL